MNCNDWKARKKIFQKNFVIFVITMYVKILCKQYFPYQYKYIYTHIQRHFTSVLCSTFYHEWKWHIPRKGFDLLQCIIEPSKNGLQQKRLCIQFIKPTKHLGSIIYIYINYLSNGKGKLSRMGFTWSSNEIHYLIMRVCWDISSIY